MFECVTVELDLKKHKHITVSCVYRTPGSDVDLFCESLEQIFSDVMPRKSMFIAFFRLYVWSRVVSVNR